MDRICVHDFTKKYGAFIAVDHVSFNVPAKTCMGLLGPNGAGKSTILKALSGMISSSEGEILINGIDIKDHTKALSNVGCVIETPDFYPEITVSEIIDFSACIHNIDRVSSKTQMCTLIDHMGLKQFADTPIGKLSKGLRQRTFLASAMVSDPDILLLDEPASGLDPAGISEFRDILLNLKNQGRTILLSSHMLGTVSRICDKTAILKQGKIVFDGTFEELRNRVKFQKIIVTVNKSADSGLLSTLNNVPGIKGIDAIENKLSITAEKDMGVISEIADRIKTSGYSLTSIGPDSDQLEEIYKRLTAEV